MGIQTKNRKKDSQTKLIQNVALVSSQSVEGYGPTEF